MVVAGLMRKSLGGEKKNRLIFSRKEPNEENKGGHVPQQQGGGGGGHPCTSGGDGRMCATCEEFLVFARIRCSLLPLFVHIHLSKKSHKQLKWRSRP